VRGECSHAKCTAGYQSKWVPAREGQGACSGSVPVYASYYPVQDAMVLADYPLPQPSAPLATQFAARHRHQPSLVPPDVLPVQPHAGVGPAASPYPLSSFDSASSLMLVQLSSGAQQVMRLVQGYDAHEHITAYRYTFISGGDKKTLAICTRPNNSHKHVR